MGLSADRDFSNLTDAIANRGPLPLQMSPGCGQVLPVVPVFGRDD